MREVVSKVSLDTGSFDIRVEGIKRSRSKPLHIKSIHAYVDVVKDGYQVKTYTTVDRQVTENTYVGDVYPTYDQALPTLTGVFLGALAAHETYADMILGHVDITAKQKGEETHNAMDR